MGLSEVMTRAGPAVRARHAVRRRARLRASRGRRVRGQLSVAPVSRGRARPGRPCPGRDVLGRAARRGRAWKRYLPPRLDSAPAADPLDGRQARCRRRGHRHFRRDPADRISMSTATACHHCRGSASRTGVYYAGRSQHRRPRVWCSERCADAGERRHLPHGQCHVRRNKRADSRLPRWGGLATSGLARGSRRIASATPPVSAAEDIRQRANGQRTAHR
jgi:hypothetical protein